MRDFVNASGFTWLNGWGVTKTLQELETEFLPTNYVVGSNGRIIWDSNQGGRLDDVLERALAAAESPKRE